MLTVLIVGLVGILALTLLERYIRTQAEAQLQANVKAIAQQAAALMTPAPQVPELQDLANSLSFLGNVRVRIFDSSSNLVVDSGQPGSSTSVLWMQPEPGQPGSPSFLVPLPQRQRPSPPWMRGAPGNTPGIRGPARGSIIVRIEEGPWGRRVVFEPGSGSAPAQPQVGQDAAKPPAGSSVAAPTATVSSSAARIITSVRYPIGSQDHPSGYIQLDSPATSGEQILAAMRRALVVAGVGAALIAVIAGLLVSRGLTAPILDLEQSAGQMSSGDLSARAPVRGAGEIGRLARQFNHMAERLQASFTALSAERDALRRFIADASHELRTPVTALGNFIELLQGPAAADSAAREEFLAESQAQVRRMEWITANLLDLSRLDAGLIALDRQPHNLSDVLQSAAAPFLAKARQKDIRLDVELRDPEATRKAQISGDRMRMEMALGNLLDNAIKFTPPGGWVRLSGEVQGDRILIQVEDSGSGILAEDLPFIFERFYRGKTSVEGSGLGLAIVKSIVQAHGGEVTAESEVGKGAKFTILLPGS